MLPSLAAEAIGTFVFFSAILAWGEPIPIAVALLAVIYVFGKVSGGHFNPGVTFMMMLKGDMDSNTAIAYVGAQLVGAWAALEWWRNNLAAKAQ